jgi:pSer/pThr/pTyr-binding forkhead associated (FHA) protein
LVSQHCRLFLSDGGPGGKVTASIEDTSSNGTFINEEKIGKGKTRELQHGDVIRIGAGTQLGAS